MTARRSSELLSLAVATPPYVIDQLQAAEAATAIYSAQFAHHPALARVFHSTGVRRRYAARPLEWFQGDHDWADRSAAYLESASELFSSATIAALAQADVSAAEVDTVVFVSSTGVLTPSLEARVLPGLGFRADVRRVPIFGLGCAGGVSGLGIAAELTRAKSNTVTLFVALELCTLAFRSDRAEKADVVSAALFGDGAAALVLATDHGEGVATIHNSTETLWPNSLEIMGWSTDPVGLGVILSPKLPAFLTANFRPVLDKAFATLHLTSESIKRVISHPGGPKVLEAIESAAELVAGTLDVERAIIADYGNMSSPTVFFVLDRLLTHKFSGPALLSALGPGFTAAFAHITVHAA